MRAPFTAYPVSMDAASFTLRFLCLRSLADSPSSRFWADLRSAHDAEDAEDLDVRRQVFADAPATRAMREEEQPVEPAAPSAQSSDAQPSVFEDQKTGDMPEAEPAKAPEAPPSLLGLAWNSLKAAFGKRS